MQQREAVRDELLAAATTALQQRDRQIAQLRKRIAELEDEVKRLHQSKCPRE